MAIQRYFKKFDTGNLAGKILEVVVDMNEKTKTGVVIGAIPHDEMPDVTGWDLLYSKPDDEAVKAEQERQERQDEQGNGD